MANDFAVFILTHGRPKQQLTASTLRKCGYTGQIYYLVDDLDDTKDEYKKLYGDDVIVFDKMKAVKSADWYTNREHLACVLYARIACDEIAKQMGLKWYCEIDDDITSLELRALKDGKLKSHKINDLNAVMMEYLQMLDVGVKMVSCLNPSMVIGGGTSATKVYRKASTMFFLKPGTINWSGSMNEDMVTSLNCNRVGDLVLSLGPMQVQAKETGKAVNESGMQETYKRMSGYERAFYAVIADPSSAKVKCRDGKSTIAVSWEKSAPKIISERWRK